MVIFHSYVSLPEGNAINSTQFNLTVSRKSSSNDPKVRWCLTKCFAHFLWLWHFDEKLLGSYGLMLQKKKQKKSGAQGFDKVSTKSLRERPRTGLRQEPGTPVVPDLPDPPWSGDDSIRKMVRFHMVSPLKTDIEYMSTCVHENSISLCITWWFGTWFFYFPQ